MQSIIANVSFGIYAVMPHGWAFMVATVALEIALLSRLLGGTWWNKKLIVPTLVANALSGATGFATSLKLNGGWWLVLWMPWVSSNEVDLKTQLSAISIYYAVAFIVTVFIEGATMYFWLRRRFGTSKALQATFLSNVCSYVLGSLAMYSWSFGLL